MLRERSDRQTKTFTTCAKTMPAKVTVVASSSEERTNPVRLPTSSRDSEKIKKESPHRNHGFNQAQKQIGTEQERGQPGVVRFWGAGGRVIMSGCGRSVPRPSAGIISVPRSTARTCGISQGQRHGPKNPYPRNGTISGTLLARDVGGEAGGYCHRPRGPSSMALTIVAKLSLSRIMVGRFLGDVRARRCPLRRRCSSFLERRRVVHAVPCHGDHFVHVLERRDDTHFVTRRHPGKHRVRFSGPRWGQQLTKTFIAHSVELRPFDDGYKSVGSPPGSCWGTRPIFLRDGQRRKRMVAGNHDHPDTGCAAF